MKIIDRRDKLSYGDMVKFIRGLKGDDILVIYKMQDEEKEFVHNKETLIREVFNRHHLSTLDDGTEISFFNENVLLETTKESIYWHDTPFRKKRLLELIGIEEDITVTENKRVEQTITIATAFVEDGEAYDVEHLTIIKRDTRKAIDFLNEHITKAYIDKVDEYFKVCIDYDINNPNKTYEWLSIEELFEKGIAK